MRPRINIVTLLVEDLDRSLIFYRDGLGFPTEGIADPADGGDHILFELEHGTSFVLLLRSSVAELYGSSVPSGSSGCILSHYAESADDVDEILQDAVIAGGEIAVEPVDLPWGYAGYFKDPDGHLWEIMWNSDEEEELPPA